MSALYFWDYPNVIIVDMPMEAGEAKAYANMYCLDAFCSSPSIRYGTFKQYAGSKKIEWTYVPFNEFPPEFRTHPLLLGVN